jgi:hypothetical protein
MATEDLKKIVARQAACGEPTSAIAERFGYSRRGMAKLLQSEEVQRLTDEERQKLDALAEELRGELVLVGRKALQNLREIIEDVTHPQCINVSRWALERILPRTDGPAVAIALEAPAIPAHVAAEIAESLNEVRECLSSSPDFDCSPYCLTGTEGLPSADD